MRGLCIILIHFVLFSVFSQSRSFRNYQVEDGLSHNSVITMLQDHRGFMWFGTKDGLNRFDGYNYKIFQHNPQDSTSIGSNFIRCLYEHGEEILVGTDTGLFIYDEKTEAFNLVTNTKDQPILDIESDLEGNIWFIASGNLHKYIPDSSNVEIYDQAYFSFLTKNKEGTLFVASQDAVYTYIPANNSLQKLVLNPANFTQPIITEIDASLFKDQLHIGTKDDGVLVYSLTKQKTSSLFNKDDKPLFVRDFLVKNSAELWVASESGLFIYDLETHDYQNLKKSYNNPYSISDNAIYCLVEDLEGGVWLGTYFGGVNYYPRPFTPFKRYFPRVGENSISGNAVREIKEDQYGNIWIGTEDAGLNRLNPKSGKFENYKPQNEGGNLSHYNIHGLLPRESELWIGTFEHGLDVMDIRTGKIIRHYGTGVEEGGLRSDFILYIYETTARDLYILTSQGVYKYLQNSDVFEPVKGFPETYHYTFLLEDYDGTLWAGTYWDGLYYYNPKTEAKGHYKFDRNDETSISSNVINGIFEDSKSRLWISTENGLNLLDRESGTFTRIRKHEGLPGNVTYALLEDENSNLWISTSNGLVNYNPESGELKTFTKSNGLLSDQFNYSSFFKDKSGEMYFGSVNGLISFNPSTFTKNTYKAPIYITDILINNEKVTVNAPESPLKKSISFTQELELNNEQSTFSLTFASLSYTAPEMTKYWYKLEGLNDNWISLGKNHEVNFTELPAGDYVFKVKALNSDGIWSEGDVKLSLEVLPPFFASKTAYALYIICVFLLIFSLLRYYHIYNRDKNNRRIQQLENAKEKEIYQAKIEFFTNIAHEIRTPLTLIKSPLEKLLKNTYKSPEIPKNLGIMEKNTSRLLNLINELLDFRKTEMQHVKLNFSAVNISELLEETYLRFSPIIQEKGLNFTVIKPAEAIIAQVDEEAFKKISSNLYSNAVKYSNHEVSLKLERDDSHLQITITNDGRLIPYHLQQRIFEPFYRVPGEVKNLGTGIGLSLAYSLAELHQGKLHFETQNNLNTFILRLPLSQREALSAEQTPTTSQNQTDTSLERNFKKNTPCLLVVEDNLELSDFIYSELSRSYNIISASNGAKALEHLEENNIQLILSDIMMPVMDGIELCKQVKENPKTKHIPVILLTAKSALNAKIEGLESGADAYITKPFSMDHLLVQISNLLENRKTILDHYSNSPLAHLKSLSLSASDQDFISKLDDIIESHMKDPNLNVESLAKFMNMSRSTLYRKVKELSEVSPNELINTTRLKKAAFLLKTTDKKIFEIAEDVGYRSQTSFGRNFQKQFKKSPSEFINDSKN